MTAVPAPGVAAVVVTFHPDHNVTERLECVAGQVARVIVVDNGSGAAIHEALAQWVERDRARRSLLANGENLGVAAALNQGVAWVSQSACEWALLLDQDSSIEPDAASRLRRIAGEVDRAGLVGGNYRDETGKLLMAAGEGREFVEMPTVITSCSLLSLAAYAAVGRFRDDFFIDGVDHEYCLRLRAHGYRVLLTTRPLMLHRLGQQRRYRLGPISFAMSNHAPVRRYYQARNRLVIAQQYLLREPVWVVAELCRAAVEAALMPMLECQGWAKLRAIGSGIRDALLRRMGPYRGDGT